MSTVGDRPKLFVMRTERGDEDSRRLNVQDSRVGFDPQAVQNLFEPFYPTKSSGMGMGRLVSRFMIKSHHGRRWASLNDGR
jgi:C4-dicarboxylate-specific signal transduction histidine kinase